METNSPIVAFNNKREYLKCLREISKHKNIKTMDINTYACLYCEYGSQASRAGLAIIKNPPDTIKYEFRDR